MAASLSIIGLFIVLGIIFSSGKGSFLIAGYNMLPKEEKNQYDSIALCKFMGKMMFALSFSMIFWVLSEALDLKWLFFVGLILFLSIIMGMLIYANTGNRFKK